MTMAFVKEKEFLICIDSDGCAMDTMEVKHRKCFGPEWIKAFGLEAYEPEATALWLRVNLYSQTRGINRFKGCALCLKKLGVSLPGLDAFLNFTETAKELSNRGLEAELAKNPNPCMEKALAWSINTNIAIGALTGEDHPYPFVPEILSYLSTRFDVVAVSSANKQALEEEWTRHGLKESTRTLLSQEDGSKTDGIKSLLEMGYSPEKVLMIGDAPGDLEAAQKNGVWFYPILVGQEAESWALIKEDVAEKLIKRSFTHGYQKQLIQNFFETLDNSGKK
ncbi:MAG: HAD family hydrolase [Eubacterium sp.]